MSVPENSLVQAARRLVGTYFVSLAEAQAWLQKNGINAVPSQRDPRLGPDVPGNTQKPNIVTAPQGQQVYDGGNGQRNVGQQARQANPSDPAYTGPAGTGTYDGEIATTGRQPGAQPNAEWAGRAGVVNPPRQQPKMQAGIEGDPGADKFAADDKYGKGVKLNTNQAGVQSNGDDDPWSIGAFDGGTYDPQIMSKWVQRAKAGDPQAAWVLNQVGYTKDLRPEDWASSRHLTTREAGFAQGGKWYTDPQANNASTTRSDTDKAQSYSDDSYDAGRTTTNDFARQDEDGRGGVDNNRTAVDPKINFQGFAPGPVANSNSDVNLPEDWGGLPAQPDYTSQRRPDDDMNKRVEDAFKNMRW